MHLLDAWNAGPASALRLVDVFRPMAPPRRLKRRHALMLLLALEVLAFGFGNADRYRRPAAATVDTPIISGHVIT